MAVLVLVLALGLLETRSQGPWGALSSFAHFNCLDQDTMLNWWHEIGRG